VTRPSVLVIDHGMGNLRSVSRALEEAGAAVSVTTGEGFESAHAVCVPGQGIFGRCMIALRESGLSDRLQEWLRDNGSYLGICLGMQILFDDSEERGPVSGLGVVPGAVRRLPPTVRVPHIGWNTVESTQKESSSGEVEYFYFDHSFAAYPSEPQFVTAWCEHGNRWAAAVRLGSALAVQFHPEKSGRTGIDFLRGWVTSL
jgi:imidazole glycerol phosphate synthase glutamine amidotransferase subunit